MADKFKVGDLVWAKMKGFPSWPGRVIEPKPEVKRPANKKNQQFVFFFGSENYAWIQEENMHIYADNRTKFQLSQRIPRGYKEAVEAIEDALKSQPDVNIKTSDLPSIEDELAQIFPTRKDGPQKDYSRDSGRKRKKSPSPLPAKAKSIKDRRSSAPPAPGVRDRRRSSHNEQKKNGKSNAAGTNKPKKLGVVTPKGLAGKAPKVLQKSAKKVRKVKPDTPLQSVSDLNASASDQTNLTDSVILDEDEVVDNNHADEDAEMGAGDDEISNSEQLEEIDTQAKSDGARESPDIFGTEELEATSSQNGLEQPQEGEEEEEGESVPATTTSEVVTEEETVECSLAIDSDPAVSTMDVVTSAKEPSSASARGENIFEMFSQSKDSGILYEDVEEVVQEELVEDEESEKPVDDGMEYAVVTVDPDGQAHMLLNAETIMDEEVVVLGQEEEVVETEGVEADDVIEEPMDTTEETDERVTEGTSPLEDKALPTTSADDSTENVGYQESTTLEPAASSSERKEGSSPGPQLPWDQTNGEDVTTTEKLEEEPLSDLPEEAPKPPADTQSSTVVEANRPKDDFDRMMAGEPLEDKHICEPEKEDLGTDHESQSVSETKPDTAAASSSSTASTETPTRRSMRARKPKEEAKDKTKREETPRTSGPGRKPKDTPKPDAAPKGRGRPPKRPSSPGGTPLVKRSKMISKTPGSPGRSAAPADYKPQGGLPPEIIEPAVAGLAKQDIIPTPMKIGFLGLGIMGTGMVDNLLKSGHEVTVWNRTAQKCRDFMKEGALKGNTPAEVVAACDVTFSCVSDPAAVKDLVFGNCGVLQGIGPGKGYVEMSTIDPDTVADVQEAVSSQGGRFLEAPVVGSRGPASTGQLVILAAGDRMLYEDCFSCFEAMGKKTFFLGETTSGCKMKLVVNQLMGTMVAGLSESLALADKVGLDQDAFLQILDLSVMSCPLVRAKGQAIMMSRFEPQFPLQHQQKDLRLSINMADSVDQPLHVATAVNELFKKAKAKGYSQHDMCAVYRAADM